MATVKLYPVVMLALAPLLGGCNQLADGLFCADDSCEWTTEEWARVRSLSPLPPPPPDPSNRYADSPAAAALGWKLYHDPDLSGPATLVDTLGRPVTHARAALGTPVRVACATCHDPRHGGGDVTSFPDHVSVGAGWYDVNSQQTLNAAHYKLLYWNGRSDSLWGQAAAVMESPVSMNGNRLAIVYTVAEKYGAEAREVFADSPLPIPRSRAETRALLARPDTGAGACAGVAPACAPGCVPLRLPAPSGATCWPQFPLDGRPGAVPGCQAEHPGEPYGDAYDCMADADRAAIDRAYVNVAKAIAAYERRLTSRNSPFDQMVAEGPTSQKLDAAARRGLKLFVGRASCIDCHNTPLLSDSNFHNIGVPQTGPGVPTESDCRKPPCDCLAGSNCLPWGWADGLPKLQNSPFRRDRDLSDDAVTGAWIAGYQRTYQATAQPRHRGAWRTPSLRDAALTAPYMHNGIFRTLEDVIWHYDQGGEPPASGVKAPELAPLFLSTRDRLDLVAFLRSLTGSPDCPELTLPPGPVVPPCL